ncbi:hypothetical protein O0550_14395 [Brevibacillus halotolerans]|nr:MULTISPECIES: hypothetical protein [Brevibacillus]MCR8964382.1 hypothetical protein [Brevibacillus laterosporus]MCZ0836537.1 hypothetical protein [Brevibacillus halotolerans]
MVEMHYRHHPLQKEHCKHFYHGLSSKNKEALMSFGRSELLTISGKALV